MSPDTKYVLTALVVAGVFGVITLGLLWYLGRGERK